MYFAIKIQEWSLAFLWEVTRCVTLIIHGCRDCKPSSGTVAPVVNGGEASS